MTETDLSGLPTPVSAGTAADLANRMDEKPCSRNRNLPGIEYALEAVGESADGLDSPPTSSAFEYPHTDCRYVDPRRRNGFFRVYRLVSPMC